MFVFSCNQEDCSILSDQAIMALDSYSVMPNDSTCSEARAALEFYINNCEEEEAQLINALGSLPCD